MIVYTNEGFDKKSYRKFNIDSNKVKLSDIESDVEPTVINAQLSKTETSVISVASTSQFANFEGIAVGAANTGYVKIGSEIIGYESVGTGVLNIKNCKKI